MSSAAKDDPAVFNRTLAAEEALLDLSAPGAVDFAFADSLQMVNGLPVPDWQAFGGWLDTIEEESERVRAWGAGELAWLLHLRNALGEGYSVWESKGAILLSSLEPNVAEATLAFMEKTLQRVVRVLEGIANVPEWGKDLLVVFDDDETYYTYVSRYYADAGEFAASGGMHINHGCSHFVTMKSDLRAIEPVIAHEMTHGCLAHLPIPAWLNEGLAVNTEQRLCPPPPARFTPMEMHAMHQRFWGEDEIQEFWSGKSFLRPDDGNMLSYDLARILVSAIAKEWSAFAAFACVADASDSGASAASRHLNVDLGVLVSALLQKDAGASYSPRPDAWRDKPELGAFHQVD